MSTTSIEESTREPPSFSLPSGKAISYSEMRTFSDWCKLQHYYRYYLRLKTRDYSELRHLTIGSIVHDVVEVLYVEDYDRDWISDQEVARLVGRVASGYQDRYRKEAWKPYFDIQAFRTDRRVAYHLVKVFIEGIYSVEAFENVGCEVGFRTELPGVDGLEMLGYKDQMYRIRGDEDGNGILSPDLDRPGQTVAPGLYMGEMKTRGASFSSRIRTVVKKDFQTLLYRAHSYMAGEDVKGVIYTVLQKPPNKLIFSDKPKEARKEIDAYYAETEPSDHIRRDVIEMPMDDEVFAEVKKKVQDIIADMNAFYNDPDETVYEKVARFDKPHPKGFPCRMCEYVDLCHRGKRPGPDFAYKKKRRA
jgi:hypothetical protein